MPRMSATTRLAISLTGLLVSLLLFGNLLGVFPDAVSMTQASRKRVVETTALSFAMFASQSDQATIHGLLQAVRDRNPDIQSIGVRRADGSLLVSVGDHELHWRPLSRKRSTAVAMTVPLESSHGQWGQLEVGFRPLAEAGGPFLSRYSPLVVTAVVGAVAFVMFLIYLRFALRQINPSRVVPRRVNEALNTLAEGLLLLDKTERIVLANTAFAEASGMEPAQLLGKPVSEFRFTTLEGEPASPWSSALSEGDAATGVLVRLEQAGDAGRTYSVNAVPILDERGECRGVLCSFEDVTEIEQKTAEMAGMLKQLRKTAKQVARQNRELERLATRDPLTNCLNRRAFFEQADQVLRAAERYSYPVSCVLLDVDHFKAVNDTYGHGTGDEVLQRVGVTLLKLVRDTDLVCRYGGEEFCILMPHTEIDKAMLVSEQLRQVVASLQFEEVSITASFGVSDMSVGAATAQELLDQADQSLYGAKRNGRNRVVRYDELQGLPISGADSDSDPAVASAELADPAQERCAIPYHAVTALVAALAFRDRATAEHSRRVADLCVMLAEDLTTRRECYLIEMGALLHDIGKMGVPDSILLKPGPLTDSEWEVMEKHDLIGAEIIRAAFASPQLSDIIEAHHYFYAGTPRQPHAPTREDIPLGARILTIADAYDAIVSDRVYRPGRSPEAAFAELRRCAGTQFDPELVELFIRKMEIRGGRQTAQFGVSKETALSIGLQIEQLVAALDDRDLARLGVLNERLHATAMRHAVENVARKSEELTAKLALQEDLIDILYTAGELLEACRSTQVSFFEGSEFRKPVGAQVSGPAAVQV